MRHFGSGMFLLLMAAGAAFADANGDFEALYGERARKVAATPATADDAAFAGELVQDAKRLGDNPQLQGLVYEKACEFGLKNPAGVPVVLEAADLLGKAQPDKAAECQAIKIKAMALLYESAKGPAKDRAGQTYLDLLLKVADAEAVGGHAAEADKLLAKALLVATALRSPKAKEIAAKRQSLAEAAKREAQRGEEATRREAQQAEEAKKREARIAQLAGRIEQNPQDTSSRQTLILLYLLDEDKPEEAAKLVTADVEEALRTYVPLAARKQKELPEATCLELAGWYESLARTASPAGKAAALERAADGYRQYLTVHTQQDVPGLKARKSLDAIEKLLGPTPGGKGRPLTLYCDKDKKVPLTLVPIPAGKFTMGSPDYERTRDATEGPQREVTITKPFYMGIYEVTQAQYVAVMGKNPSSFKGPQNPVENVSWNDAAEFCKKLSEKTGKKVRLPTEAEWEYACRAGTTSVYSFGDDEGMLGDYAWFDRNSDKKTHPVGEKKPNPVGLYDMHGNVWEWCSDWFADSYANASKMDPTGPVSGTLRVPRGGCWSFRSQDSRSARRGRDGPGARLNRVGFRVAVGAVGVD